MLIQINLLQNQKNYKRIEKAFYLFRLATLGIAVVITVSLISIFALNANAHSAYDSTVTQRQMLVDAIQQREDQEAQILLIQEKVSSLNMVLQEVPDYSQQIETVLAFMPEATSSGRIVHIATDENVADVTLAFPDINALTGFLEIIDSELFQSTFDVIELNTITYTDPTKELELTLHVGFKSETK